MPDSIEDLLHSINNEKTWVALAFCLFVYALYKPIKSALLKLLDSKISEIKNRIDQSDALVNDANNSLLEIKNLMDNLKNKEIAITNSYKKNLEDTAKKYKKEHCLFYFLSLLTSFQPILYPSLLYHFEL